MNTCSFCHARLAAGTGVCGVCGRTTSASGVGDFPPEAPPIVPLSDPSHAPTFLQGNDLPTVQLSPSDAETMRRQSRTAGAVPDTYSGASTVTMPTDPASPEPSLKGKQEEEEEDEEKKRRLALLGLAAPLLGEAISGNAPPAPMVAGTPQITPAAMVPGTPHFAAGERFADLAAQSPPAGQALGLPQVQPQPIHPAWQSALPSAHSAPASPLPGFRPGTPGAPARPRPSSSSSPGCSVWLIVVLVPLVILATIGGVTAAAFPPSLTLGGNSVVTPGSSLHLHGSGFLPNASVTLTLDDNIPLRSAHSPGGSQPVAFQSQNSMSLLTAIPLQRQIPSAGNTLTAGSSGNFDVTIPVGQDWKPGRHSIRAAESFTLRSASLSFTVASSNQAGSNPDSSASATPTDTPAATATPTATDTPAATATPASTPVATPTARPAATPTPTPIVSSLSAITPSSASLGPVAEGSTQAVTTLVTLSTTGSGTVTWAASWNRDQASWLQLNITSGQIQAPNTQQVRVQATPTGLKADTYTAAITFSSPQSNKTFTLTVTFKIQAGCLNVSPTTLTFTGIAGTSDPSPQTVRLNNCGLAGTWSGTPTTDAGSNWLSITPTGAAIDANGTQSVTVTASNVRTKLPVGRYTGRITFTISGTEVGVVITLIVNPPPVIAKLSASPTLLTNTNETCRYGETGYTCHVTLSSNKDASSSLDWKASISGGKGITVSENSGTLAPGESQDVIVTIPSGNCGTTATITFQGPSNAVDVGIKWASCIK